MLRERTGWSRSQYVVAVCGVWLVLILLVGYSGMSTDHYQHLLHPWVSAEPWRLVGDWFAHETEPYHFLFQALATVAFRVGAVSQFLMLWHGATLLALAIALVLWVRSLEASAWALVLAVPVLVLGAQRGWGDVPLVGPSGLPHLAGVALASIAVWAAIWKRPVWLIVATAATVYAHGSAGFWTVIVVCVLVATQWRDWKPNRRLLLFGVVLLLPFAALVVAAGLVDPAAPDVYRILFFARAPHHYAPQLASADVHLVSISVVGLLVLSAGLASEVRRALSAFVATLVVIFATGFVFVAVAFWPPPIRLFGFRMFPVGLGVAVAVLAGIAAGRQRPPRHRVLAAIGLIALLVAPWSPVLAVVLTVAALASFWVVPDRLRLWAPAVSWVGLATAIAMLAAIPAYVDGYPWSAESWPTPALTELAQGVAESSQPGSIIVVPPSVTGLRLEADRAIVVNFKLAPLAGSKLQEWGERMQAITGLDPMTAETWRDPSSTVAEQYQDAYLNMTGDRLHDAAVRYGATHVLLTEGSRAFDTFSDEPWAEQVWRNHEFALYQLR